MSSIFVTGASGMIGQYLISSLLAKKYTVYAVDSRTNRFVGKDPNLHFTQCDILDTSNISAILKREPFDAVIHLANSVDNDLDSLVTDAEMKKSKQTDKYFYDLVNESKAKCIILLSTTDVYGAQKGREPIRETAPEKGSTNYAELKLTSEKYFNKAFRNSSTIPIIARVAPIYDAEFTDNLHCRVYDPKDKVGYIYNDGSYGYTFCCVYNLIDFINGIISKPSGKYDGIYNVCDSRILTAKEIIDYEKTKHRIGAVVQKTPGGFSHKGKMKVNYKSFDPSLSFHNWNFDNTRAKRIAPMKWNLSNTK